MSKSSGHPGGESPAGDARPNARPERKTALALEYMRLAERHYRDGGRDIARVAMSMASGLLSGGPKGQDATVDDATRSEAQRRDEP